MLFPPQLGIKGHIKIFSIGIWNFCAIDEDWLLTNLLVWKSICTDLESVSFIRQILVQISTLLTADCSFLVELPTVSHISLCKENLFDFSRV
jgi:hypothetical protein